MDKNYWDDYDNALSEQYDEELNKKLSLYDEYDEPVNPTIQPKGDYKVIERKKPLWDVSGDDSSLNPNFW